MDYLEGETFVTLTKEPKEGYFAEVVKDYR